MNLSFFLLQTDGVLPPPPEPTGSPSIDTTRVVAVVIVSLIVIVLAALALKPLVLRGRPPVDDPSPAAPEPEEPDVIAPPVGSIIQFPRLATIDDEVDDWDEANDIVADRLNRVVGDGGARRRKLGDRHPGSTPAARGAAAPAYAWPTPPAPGPRPVLPFHGGTSVAPASAQQIPSPQPEPVWSPVNIDPAPAIRPADPVAPPVVKPVWSPPPPIASNATWEFEGGWPADLQPNIPASAWPPVVESAPAPPQAQVSAPSSSDDPLDDILGKLPPAPPPQASAAPEPERRADGLGPLSAGMFDDLGGEPPVVLPFRQSPEPPRDESILGSDFDEIAAELDAATARLDDEIGGSTGDWGLGESAAETPASWTSILAPNAAETSELPEAALDPETMEGIQKTIRELLFCANVGELLHGFALYTDPYLFRFMDATGMSEIDFRRAFSAMKPKAPETWTRLKSLSDVVRRPDGRIEATASYVDPMGAPANGRERYRFAFNPARGLWMIDDIATID